MDRKASFSRLRMLNALGDEILQQQDCIFVSRHFKTGNITALVYHYPPELTNVISGDNCAKEALTGSPKLFTLQIDGLRPGSMVNIEKLDKNNGFAYSKCQAMGCPEPHTVSQTQELKTAAFATKKQKLRVGHSGHYLFKDILQPWNCVMINIART